MEANIFFGLAGLIIGGILGKLVSADSRILEIPYKIASAHKSQR
jgi:hypothetical protein